MFPGEGGSLLRFSAVKNGQQFFQPPDFVPAFPENMAPGEEQFPLLAADMALEERGQPLGNRIQFLPERGKPLCFRPPEKEYRIQWNCPMVPGVSGSRHGFSGPTMCSSFHERPQDMDGTFSNSVPRRSRVFSSSQVQDRNWKFHSGGSVVMSPCRAIFKMSWSG